MGIFRPIIEKGLDVPPDNIEPSNRIFTPATVMSALRPVFALQAAHKLITGKKNVTRTIFLMAASDAEGNLARFIDKRWPKSGMGSSKVGAQADQIADTLGGFFTASGIIAGRNVTLSARLAAFGVLAHEGYKAKWALAKNQEYQNVTGQRLEIASTVEGKESMAEKLASLMLAGATADMAPGLNRSFVGFGALVMATSGVIRGESQRKVYNQTANEMICNELELRSK